MDPNEVLDKILQTAVIILDQPGAYPPEIYTLAENIQELDNKLIGGAMPLPERWV